MKKIFITLLTVITVFLAIGSLDQAQAIPMGAAQRPGDYFFGDEDLDRVMVGAYYLNRERDITTLGVVTSMQNIKTMGYVGYEFIYGMYGYLTVGSTKTQFAGLPISDVQAEYGLGMQFNILDHEIPDPTLLEDRIRVNASMQYTQCSAYWLATPVDWEEFYGSLTISIINDIEGNKYFHCNSIGFFFGAVYSDLRSSAIDEDSAMGYSAGLEIYYSEKVSFEFGTESLDQGSLFAGVNIAL